MVSNLCGFVKLGAFENLLGVMVREPLLQLGAVVFALGLSMSGSPFRGERLFRFRKLAVPLLVIPEPEKELQVLRCALDVLEVIQELAFGARL